jgi:hypothetical protein
MRHEGKDTNFTNTPYGTPERLLTLEKLIQARTNYMPLSKYGF